MHKSALMKAQHFVSVYAAKPLENDRKYRVLEVGSKSYDTHATNKPMFSPDRFDYVGLDVESGPNVDVVPKNGYVWDELADESFDYCMSSQTFEHNPFFWVTFCEMARILRPGGLMFVLAPGNGPVHRYPYDCWRFYPDSWAALCTLSGVEMVECYYEPDHIAQYSPGGKWRDSGIIGRKPTLTGADKEAYYNRLKALVEPYSGMSFTIQTAPKKPGPCFSAYERQVTAERKVRPLRYVRDLLRGQGRTKHFDPNAPEHK